MRKEDFIDKLMSLKDNCNAIIIREIGGEVIDTIEVKIISASLVNNQMILVSTCGIHTINVSTIEVEHDDESGFEIYKCSGSVMDTFVYLKDVNN